jgi:hypothetical protein
VISDLRLLTTRNKIPYFCLKITIPQQVIELSDKKPENGAMRLEFYGKVDALDWGSAAAEADTLRFLKAVRFPEKPIPIIFNIELEDVEN